MPTNPSTTESRFREKFSGTGNDADGYMIPNAEGHYVGKAGGEALLAFIKNEKELVKREEYTENRDWEKEHLYKPLVQVLLRSPAFWEVIVEKTTGIQNNSKSSLPTSNPNHHE